MMERIDEVVTIEPSSPGLQQTIEVGASTPMLIAIQALFPEKSANRVLANDLLKFFSAVKYYPLHNFEETTDEILVSGSTYQKWKSGESKDLNSLSSLALILIDMYEERRESFEELKSLVGPDGMDLIYDIQITPHDFSESKQGLLAGLSKNIYYFLTFDFPSGEKTHRLSINDLSFGTVRILFLLVSMLYDEASVALIEQPEDGVHSGLVGKVMPLLRAYSLNSQFLVASHSTAILNRVQATEVRLINMREGKTEARALSDGELHAAAAFLEDDGPLSDFLESIEGA
jgi:hypothetical protein